MASVFNPPGSVAAAGVEWRRAWSGGGGESFVKKTVCGRDGDQVDNDTKDATRPLLPPSPPFPLLRPLLALHVLTPAAPLPPPPTPFPQPRPYHPTHELHTRHMTLSRGSKAAAGSLRMEDQRTK